MFGALELDLIEKITSFPRKYDKKSHLRDQYIWTAGCTISVKVRNGELKIKWRDIARSKLGIQDWKASKYRFPIPEEAINQLAIGLKLDIPITSVNDEADLLALLQPVSNSIKVITVVKDRQTYYWPIRDDVIIELAKISSPEIVTSLSVESTTLHNVIQFLDALRLTNRNKNQASVMNYLDAVGIWAQGKNLVEK